MKVFTILDTDLIFVHSVHETLNGVFSAAVDTMNEGGYESFTFTRTGDNEATIIFPHNRPDCVGHWMITRTDLEE